MLLLIPNFVFRPTLQVDVSGFLFSSCYFIGFLCINVLIMPMKFNYQIKIRGSKNTEIEFKF